MSLQELKQPFKQEDIEWREARCGISAKGNPWVQVLAYVTNRAIMERLDKVVGPENWRNEFCPAPNGGTLCGILIRIGDEWVCKWDGADNTNFEAVKGGLSGAMKRAAVQWGIGRYLYNLDVTFADCGFAKNNGEHRAYDKQNKKTIYWTTPKLPAWALPGGSGKPLI